MGNSGWIFYFRDKRYKCFVNVMKNSAPSECRHTCVNNGMLSLMPIFLKKDEMYSIRTRCFGWLKRVNGSKNFSMSKWGESLWKLVGDRQLMDGCVGATEQECGCVV